MIVNHSTLYKALQKAAKATGVTAVPATEYLQLTVTSNKLHIAGCNMKFYIRADIDITEGSLNSFLVHAKKLLDYLSGLPDQPLTITADKNLLVKYTGGKFTMPILSDDNFPVPAMPKTKNTMQISSDVFNEGLHRVSWARAKDKPDMPDLECLCVKLSPGKLMFVGAASEALAAFNIEAEHNVTGELLIPDYCLPVFDFEPEKQLAIVTDGTRLSISYDNMLINAALLDAKYRDISGHMALKWDKVISMDKDLLVGSLERIKKFAGGENKTVKLVFGKELTMSAKNIAEDEQIEEILPIQYTGNPVEIATNASVLLNAVKRIPEINLEISDYKKPLLLRDGENLTVVSPVAY
jgi:DNA polymerase III subunit beta